MQLEDHLGDILRKAREAAQISPAAAARAAGLPETEWTALEADGRWSARQPNWEEVAPLLKLHANKMAQIAEGWTPAPKDLSTWRELRVFTTEREAIRVNCFLIWDEVTREAALFDTGWNAHPILELMREQQLALRHLFLTHTHDDHIAAMGALREAFPKLLVHTNSKHAPPHQRNRPNDCLHLGSLRITNRATPGHAEDGVIYVAGNWPEDAPHVAFVGDTLFAGSLATGFQSIELLRQSVRAQILSLPPGTLLGPGHGPWTSVAEERAHNPFFD